MTTPRPVFAAAYAKINLTLDVLGRRDDGYHTLASVMQTIALHDTIRFELAPANEIRCVTDEHMLQANDNLAMRAAALLHQQREGSPGVRLELHKAIPIQGGLGGGSSDAARVLTMLNQLWRLDLSDTQLEALGARLGSDVPFFIRGGTALIEGRGELVTPLPDAEPLWLVLVKPTIGVPTAQVFRQLQPAAYTDGHDTAAVVEAIRAGRPIPFKHLTNALEPGVLRDFPAVAEAHAALRRAGAHLVRLSGSGPTLYAPFRRLEEATPVVERLRPTGLEMWLTHTVPASAANMRVLQPDSFV
jgi:4-diphosphocytidyl-2-C-methyl-D-erythritol kinase